VNDIGDTILPAAAIGMLRSHLFHPGVFSVDNELMVENNS